MTHRRVQIALLGLVLAIIGIGPAIADCPTNPNGAIPTLEKALREMKVELPKR